MKKEMKKSSEWIEQMKEKFNEETCIETLSLLLGDKDLKEMPHYDTLNSYLEKLSPECLSDLRKKMVRSLLRGKQFYRGRLLGRIKKEYPRLPICIQGDALCAAELMMKNYRKNGWAYIFTQVDTRQKLAVESFEWICEGNGATEVKNIGKELGRGRYANHMEETPGFIK